MKKIIALLICVITVLGLFVGCSDNGVPVTDPNGPVLKTENYFFNAIEVEYFRMLSYRRMYEAYESALGEDVAHEFATNAATKAKIRASLEQILKLCEEAKVRGIEVGAEEKEYAESVVMDHIVKARNEGKEVEDIYGKNVTHENMLKVLELEALSKKVESIIYKELEGEILNDSAKVNTYITLSFQVSSSRILWAASAMALAPAVAQLEEWASTPVTAKVKVAIPFR